MLTVTSVVVGCGTHLLNSDAIACSSTRATKGAMHDAVLPPKTLRMGSRQGKCCLLLSLLVTGSRKGTLREEKWFHVYRRSESLLLQDGAARVGESARNARCAITWHFRRAAGRSLVVVACRADGLDAVHR